MNSFPSNLAARLNIAGHTVRSELLAERNPQGHWQGELSNSSLATATAISALSQYRDHLSSSEIDDARIGEMIDKGSRWLLSQQNDDGGWGDTDQSHSNIASSMLVVAAFTLAGKTNQAEFREAVASANEWIDQAGRIQGLRHRYGKDKTFAVPILANCALAGLVPWKEVSALPCEAVILPQSFYRFISLPVVSYAIPALVGIGQVKFIKDPPWNPITRLLRKLSVKRGLTVLEKMQPGSGGFLEAIPLTCFVAMSLAHSGRADHEVVHRCIQFVSDSFRDLGESGTWPIDTNLATWNTTLAINALDATKDNTHLTDDLLNWVLECQYTQVHPFTGAAPGGWGWSDLSGAVPDADDTPGAMLAIRTWLESDHCSQKQQQRIRQAAEAGIQWLLKIQNRDHGWPTFCRGWGRLPFDRSGNDITAHVIRALVAWQSEFQSPKLTRAINRGFEYLRKNQLPEGGWLPLWFGNQDHPREENQIYGTVKVLLAYLDSHRQDQPEARKAVQWLLRNQNEDSGWGGGQSNNMFDYTGDDSIHSSVQETALAVELLARLQLSQSGAAGQDVVDACARGTEWLVNAIENGKTAEKWPIGFYFAKLWYYERLYPLIFSVSAIQIASKAFTNPDEQAGTSSH